ncbi:MAG: OmpA family protein [Crocinitomicaceae bacterium]|nr:OmpA family protein [Crocinitomicaceae bacterium]
MKSWFPFILSFIAAISWGQTYEILEVEIQCEAFELKELNTPGSDFSPFVYGDQFYMTSSREYDLHNLGENNWKRSGYLNIFTGSIKGDSEQDLKIKNIQIVSNKLMTDNHTGPLCISASGDTMYFSKVQEVAKKNRSKNEKYRPQLYMSMREGKDWGEPIALPFNNEQYSFGHPYFDSRLNRLYFASDLSGGKGGKDIYYSEIKNGEWGLPVNLEEINTESNEVFPCVVDEYIFYASDKTGGKGGLDLYWKIVGQKGDFPQEVVGLNSEMDDFGMYVYPGMKKGFYSTNKGGNDDILFFKMDKKVTIRNALAGKFTYRNIDGNPQGLKVIVVNEDDDILFETNTDKKGEFFFSNIDYDGEFKIRAKTEDELYLTIYDKDGNPITDLVTDEVGAFSYKRLGYDKSGTLTLIPEDMIDLELNQGHLTGQFIYENIPGEYPNQLKVLLEDEDGNMKFQTFTDKNGNFDFRQLDMSENYILTVPENDEELILLIFDKKGNVVAQLKSDPKGSFTYRKLKPSFSNTLKVIEENDEMFVLESQTVSGYFEYKNLSGEYTEGLKVQAYNEDGLLLNETYTDKQGRFRFRNLPVEDNFLFKVDEMDANLQLDDFTLYIFDRNGKKIAQLRRGQNDFFIFKPLGFDTDHHLTHVTEDSLDIEINIKTNYDIVVVYFDSNKSNVKNADLGKLSELYKLLKSNPALKVEVNAYADAKNSDEYNLILSGKRGDWVVEYFVNKGLSSNRFIVNAYGETQLVDETNDALNRRAEIRIY